MNAFHGTLILALPLAFCLPALAQDHLEPEEWVLNQREWQRDYAARLREVLFKHAESNHLVHGLPSRI